MTARAAGRKIGSGPATPEQREHLFLLHMEVYGYVSVATAREIEALTKIRAAQETATLVRARETKRILDNARAECTDLHRRLFGKQADHELEKQAEIAAMDLPRVVKELAILRRMDATVPGLPERCERHSRSALPCPGVNKHCETGTHCVQWSNTCRSLVTATTDHDSICCNCGASIV